MHRRVAILMACLLTASVAVAWADRADEIPDRVPFALFPMQIGDFEGVPQAPLTEDVVAVLGVEDYLTRAYFTQDRSSGLGLYIGYWESQRQGDTMHSPLNCLPGSGWEPVSRATLMLSNPSDPAAGESPVNRIVIRKGIERQLVLYWYQSHGRIVASEYWGKFHLVADAMRLNRTDGALVRVIAPVADDTVKAEEDAERLALRFVDDLMPALAGFIPE